MTTYSVKTGTDKTYRYEVMGSDGECYDEFRTKAAADRDAAKRNAEEQAEAREELAGKLRDEIEVALQDCEDLATLQNILSLLKA